MNVLRVLVIAGGLVLGLARPVNADRSAALSSVGACPTREALIAALRLAVPGVTIAADPSGGELRIVVTERADSYRVEVEGVVRSFVDAAQRCDDRARKIAVVVALALEPPVIAPAAEPAAPAIEPPAPATADAKPQTVEISAATVLVAQADPAPELHIETGGVIESAAGVPGSNNIFATGIDAHVVLRRNGLGIVAGGAVISPVDLAMAGATARVQRVPFDVAVRAEVGKRVTQVALELGPRFTIQRSEGIIAAMSQASATRLETGIRGAARMAVWPWRDYGVFVALQAEFVPRPSRFTLPMQGEVGAMPSWWVGTSIGLAVRVR